MTAAAPPHTGPAPLQRRPALAVHPLVCALVVVAAVTAVRLMGTVDSDVAWQLWIAQRLHAGARLYRDIIEVNPPLWFWMAVPIERLSALLHLHIESVAISAISLFAALSLAATDRLCIHIEGGRRAAFLAYAALVLVAVPWMHTGQREQIALIAAVPYVALAVARLRGAAVAPALAATLGAAAALGFGLKHYFLVVPVLLELWIIAAQRRRWRPFRPETVALTVTGTAYAAAIILFAPDYLERVVPFVRLLYGGLTAQSWSAVFGPFAVITGLLLLAAATQARLLGHAKASLAIGLLVAAVGFAAAYLIQFKGWPYHTLPALGCASLALAALLAETPNTTRLLRLLAPPLLVLPLVLAAKEQLTKPLPTPDLESAVSGLKRGDTIAFLGTEAAVPWAVTLQNGYRYPSRYISFWMVIAVNANEARGRQNPSVSAAWAKVVRETVQDFRCIPPARIIVARPLPGDTANFDILPMFTRDPAFAELLAHYRPLSRTTFDTYELARPLAPMRASRCRQGV